MSAFYAGFDLASRSSWLCVLDQAGDKILNRRLPNEPERITNTLAPYLPEVTAVVESTFNWYWLVDLLQDLGVEVKLAHPLYLKAIAYAKVKTDQVDAHTLAQLLRLDYIPEAYIYPRGLRSTRDLLRRRHRLVNLRACLYRDLQLQFLRHNIQGYGRKAIKQVDGRHLRALLDHPHERLAGRAELHVIRSLDGEIVQLDRAVGAATRRLAPVKLLRSVPGLGKTLAPTVLLEIGSIHRFPSHKAFSSYCRLAPTIAQSGKTTRKGRNRKQGNRYLKWAFSEAAQLAIQRYPYIRETYQQLFKKKKKKILAKAIIAHKLAVAAFHVLREEVPYRPEAFHN